MLLRSVMRSVENFSREEHLMTVSAPKLQCISEREPKISSTRAFAAKGNLITCVQTPETVLESTEDTSCVSVQGLDSLVEPTRNVCYYDSETRLNQVDDSGEVMVHPRVAHQLILVTNEHLRKWKYLLNKRWMCDYYLQYINVGTCGVFPDIQQTVDQGKYIMEYCTSVLHRLPFTTDEQRFRIGLCIQFPLH